MPRKVGRFGATDAGRAKARLRERLALLKNAEFRQDVREFRRVHQARLARTGFTFGQYRALCGLLFRRRNSTSEREFLKFCDTLTLPQLTALQAFFEALSTFLQKWHVVPLMLRGVVGDGPRERRRLAVMTGQWAVIPVFPWTNEKDVRAVLRSIRKKLPRRHKDGRRGSRRAARSLWLERHGHSRLEIAREVWGYVEGLRRKNLARAIRELPESDEQMLFGEARATLARRLRREPTAREINRLIERKLQGSEPLANAAMRMARSRYLGSIRALAALRESPREIDAVSYGLTTMFREVLWRRGGESKGKRLTALVRTLYKDITDSTSK